MTTNQPESTDARLNRLETLFLNMGETVVGHDNTIDVLVANIQQLTENVNNLTEQTSRNFNILGQRMDSLAEQAAQDRQQAAIERQEFRRQMEQRELEIRQIWEYLRDAPRGLAS